MFRQLTALLLAALIAVPCCCCAFSAASAHAPQAKTCCGLPVTGDQDQQPSDQQPCHCQASAKQRDASDTTPPATATTWLLLAAATWQSLDTPFLSQPSRSTQRSQAPPPPPPSGRHVRALISSFLI